MGYKHGWVVRAALAVWFVVASAFSSTDEKSKVVICSSELARVEINGATWRGALFGHNPFFSNLIQGMAQDAASGRSLTSLELFEDFPELSRAEVKSLSKDPDALMLMQTTIRVLLTRKVGWQQKLIDWTRVQTHFPWNPASSDDVAKDFAELRMLGTIAFRLLRHEQVDQLETTYHNAYERGEVELKNFLSTQDVRNKTAFSEDRTEANAVLLLLGWLATCDDSDETVRPSAIRALLEAGKQDQQARLLLKYLKIDADTLSYGPLYQPDSSFND